MPWSRVLLEKLIVTQPDKKLSTIYGIQGSLLCTQQPATRPYPQPDKSSPHLSRINSILPSMPISSMSSHPFMFSD